MKWRLPKDERPKDGDYILIREFYKSPRYGQFKINYRVILYFEEFGFEHEYKVNRNLYKYKITHWMSIEEPKTKKA